MTLPYIMNRSWRRVQSVYGVSYIDINQVVAITKRNQDEKGYDIHMSSGTIFTTPHLLPFMENIMA